MSTQHIAVMCKGPKHYIVTSFFFLSTTPAFIYHLLSPLFLYKGTAQALTEYNIAIKVLIVRFDINTYSAVKKDFLLFYIS